MSQKQAKLGTFYNTAAKHFENRKVSTDLCNGF
jgi:hypothetical protein